MEDATMGHDDTTGRRRVIAAEAALADGATALRATNGSAGGNPKARQLKAMSREVVRMAPDIREVRAVGKRMSTIRGWEDMVNYLMEVADRIKTHRQGALHSYPPTQCRTRRRAHPLCTNPNWAAEGRWPRERSPQFCDLWRYSRGRDNGVS